MTRLWVRQVLAVARFETVKTLFSARALPIWMLAALPVFGVVLLMAIAVVAEPPSELRTLGGTAMFFANVYQFILRGVVYFGCVFIFMNLFRGEVLDRSLHYYFLAPIRREVLVVGKFLAGWLGSSILFVATTLVSLFLFYSIRSPFEAARHLLFGAGAGQLWGYVAVTSLACVGYGAVFLVIGLFLRNPVVPALLIWTLEWLNPFLPSMLKKVSVLFYLQSMLPVQLTSGPFAVLAEPTPVWLSIPGLLLFTGLTVALAGLRIRRMEIAYGLD